jgi:hypothetical protein
MATFEQKDVIDTLIGFKHYIKNTSFLGGKDVIKQICTTKELNDTLVYIFNPDKITSVYNTGIEKFNRIKFENIEEFTNETYFNKKFLYIKECNYNLKKIDCIFTLMDIEPNFRNLYHTYYKLKHLVWNSTDDIKDNLIEFSDEAYRYNISLVSISEPVEHTAWKIVVKQDRTDITFHTHIINTINQISKRVNGYCSMKISDNAYVFYIHHINSDTIAPNWKFKNASQSISDCIPDWYHDGDR